MTCSSIRGAAWLAAALLGMAAVPARGANPGMKFGLAVNDQFASGEYYWSSDTRADREPFPAVFVGFPMGRWRLVPTASFLEKGGYARYEVAIPAQGWSHSGYVHGSLWYLSCQSDLHFTFPLGNADFYFLAAPRIDILVSDAASSHDDYGGAGASEVPVPSYEPVTVGFALGLGQDISLGKDVLFIEFRYDRDLTPYFSVSDADFTGSGITGPSWYNRMFMFQIGVRVNASRSLKRTESAKLWPSD